MMAEIEANSEKVSPRRWTVEEYTLLVDLLLSLHLDGKWKAEGGFKSGYLVHLEKLISEKMPDAGLRATNIESRLGYLRKRFNALLEIKHKGSGFGWDDTLKMVTGDRKLFDEWCKSHKDAKGMFRKPFPLFDAMEEIYSKDRATGAKGNTPLDRDDQDAINETNENAQQEVQSGELTEGSETTKRCGDESLKRPSKKMLRKNKEILNVQKSFENLMGTMLENSNAQIAQLTTMLEAPKNYKVGLREELGKVQGISRVNILTLCSIMTESDVAVFRDLTDEDDKYDFLAMILNRP
ncbi:hypothetical protein RND81_03G136000 [Saponaria officinalis]|uniref:Myb/SANT-like domain-containing protein n=1 Tax=Saponaria officinalis TaxID=3572 RepID=A0AAW1M8I1_SAPOF